MTASQGKWVLASHLKKVDQVVTRFILENQAGIAKSRILIIDSPPRHGKSSYVSEHVSAWFKAMYPEQDVILTSYEGGFAAEWGAKARNVLQAQIDPGDYRSPPVGSLFDVQVDPKMRAADRWGLVGHRGTMRTAGAGGPITGKGCGLLIVDDPIKNSEEAMSEKRRAKLHDWWTSTAVSRLEPYGCAILMATRWHREDPTGWLLTRAGTPEGEPVLHIHMPALAEENDWLGRKEGEALWPERWPRRRLLTIKRGSNNLYWWNALYQGNPTAHTATEWPDSYFGDFIWVNDEPLSASNPQGWPNDFQLRVVTVDPSKGKTDKPGDYCAIVFIGVRDNLIYVDADVARKPLRQITSDTLTMCHKYKPDYVGIESNAFQELLAIHFEEQSASTFGVQYPVYKVNHTLNKQFRIRRLDPYLASRQFRFRASSLGCRLLVQQMRDFPLADFDDGPDALEMACRLPIDIADVSQ